MVSFQNLHTPCGNNEKDILFFLKPLNQSFLCRVYIVTMGRPVEEQGEREMSVCVYVWVTLLETGKVMDR